MKQNDVKSWRWLGVLLGLTLAITGLTHSMTAAATLFSDDFEDGNTAGWSTSGGSWSVVSDGGKVAKQSSASANAYSYAGSSSWNNYTVQLRAKALGFNGSGSAFGVSARYQSTSNHYYLTLNNANQLRLGKKASSGSAVLASKTFAVSAGTWYTLKLSVNGNQLQGYVNGILQLTATDSTLGTGKIGLIALNTSAEFDDVTVDGTGVASPTPTITKTPGQSVKPTSSKTPTPSPTVTASLEKSPTPSFTAQPTQTPIPVESKPVGFCNEGSVITGGAGGQVVYAATAAELAQYGDSNTPYIIYVTKSMELSGMSTHIRSNKTVIGVGDVTLSGGGLYLYKSKNVIIRNLTITGSSEDNIGIHYSDHVWIDHCTLSNSTDGNIDMTQASDYITISWCKFFYTVDNGHNFVNLIASSDADNGSQYHVTFHHNWWSQGCIERMPSVRFGRAHVFNNYYSASGNNYCVRTRVDSECRVENNYFENVQNPWEQYITGSGTQGKLWASNNNVAYLQSAYGVTWTGDKTNKDGTVRKMVPGTDNVFIPFYTYTLDNSLEVKSLVTTSAGAGKGPFAK